MLGVSEKKLENLINNFPNILHASLHRTSQGNPWIRGFLGEVNVFLRQLELRDCSGVLDIAFVTDRQVHIAEIKRGNLDLIALEQLRRYLPVVQQHYPSHELRGYLVGTVCHDRPLLSRHIGAENISVLTIPNIQAYTACSSCGAGVRASTPRCPVCEARPAK